MRVPMIQTGYGFGPDLPDGFRGEALLTADGDYELTPAGRLDVQEAQLAAVEAQLAAVEALATKADATAQEIARAVKNAGRPTT